MSELKAGVTAPPFHPWCRTCTCPYFDDEFSKGGERFSRLAEGTVEYVLSDMGYDEWYGKYVKGDGGGLTGGAGDGIINLLPNFEKAVIPDAKIFKYALVEKNKAKVFESALGYSLNNGSKLIENIKNNLGNNEAVLKNTNQYGDLYEVRMKLRGENGKEAIIITGWIVDSNKKETRLTSAYVSKRKMGVEND